MTTQFSDDPSSKRHPRATPVTVQILSTLMFGGFAITATVLAFVYFWPAGVALALLLGWRGSFAPSPDPQPRLDEVVSQLTLSEQETEDRRSGNSSFDAYRSDVIDRLEIERTRFEGFMDRLRDAKDRSEFDRFMDERATQAQARVTANSEA